MILARCVHGWRLNELMTGTRQWNTGIGGRGRIYFGADKRSMPSSCRQGRRHERLLLLLLHSYRYRDSHLKLPTSTPVPSRHRRYGYSDCDANPGQITLTARAIKYAGSRPLTSPGAGRLRVDVDITVKRLCDVHPRMTFSTTDSIGGHGHATYTYQVCNAGTQIVLIKRRSCSELVCLNA